MKRKFILWLCVLVAGVQVASAQHACAKAKQKGAASLIYQQSREAQLSALTSHELRYDVKFVHLNLNVERTTKYISGNVKTVATVTNSAMDTFMTLLHQNHTIDSIRFNGLLLPATRADSAVKVKLPSPLPVGSSFTVNVYYRGTPPVGGSAIGSGFDTGTDPNFSVQATWSLSEALVAYHWWPCKQILTDKIDSSWVFVTTDSINKAGSNGRLQQVVTVGNKKRYEWKSRAPIAYYLISVAVAKYKELRQYAKPQYLPNDSILIQNYIYEEAATNTLFTTYEQPELDRMPETMEFLCDIYGMYPFYKEKYGHCMAPFGGGMEHQTMTTLFGFDFYIDAHELGHQWWGDNVTCKSWADIWMNEGFASYTEFLVAQYLDPANFTGYVNAFHNDVMASPGGSIFFTNADTLNSARIFDGRLTYEKGGSIIRSLQFVTNSDSVWFNTLRGFQNTYKHKNASVTDFMNYYQAQTGINPTQFFNQWYYGQGFPTFSVSFNTVGNNLVIKSVQGTSMPSVTPLFITPVEFKIVRQGYADTIVRVVQNQNTQIFVIPLNGSVTAMSCDPNNWIINRTHGPVRDQNLTGTESIAERTAAASRIRIWPNPTKGLVQIDNETGLQGKLRLFDVSGRQLLEKNLEGTGSIDLGNYARGLYLIRLSDSDGNELRSQRVIKE